MPHRSDSGDKMSEEERRARRRVQNRESARRIRERSRNEDQQIQETYQANEARIKELEKAADKLSKELKTPKKPWCQVRVTPNPELCLLRVVTVICQIKKNNEYGSVVQDAFVGNLLCSLARRHARYVLTTIFWWLSLWQINKELLSVHLACSYCSCLNFYDRKTVEQAFRCEIEDSRHRMFRERRYKPPTTLVCTLNSVSLIKSPKVKTFMPQSQW